MCKMYTLCVHLPVLDPPLASLTHTVRHRHRNEFKKQFKQTAYMLYLPHYSAKRLVYSTNRCALILTPLHGNYYSTQ